MMTSLMNGGNNVKKYGEVIPHIYKDKEYLFRYNYEKQSVENVIKLEPEERDELIREAAEDDYLYGNVGEVLTEALESYNETGYVWGKNTYWVSEEEFLKDPGYYMNVLSEEIYDEEESIAMFG